MLKGIRIISNSFRLVQFIILISLVLTFLISCKKDPKDSKGHLPLSNEYSFLCEDTAFDWANKEFDTNFGVIVRYNGKKSVWRTIYDSNDPNIIYYLTTEFQGIHHHLWRYNRTTKNKTLLAQNVLNNISIHSNGWIALEMGWEVYKIKSNGDSLIKVSGSEGGYYPNWDESGKNIYYLCHTTNQIFIHNHKLNAIRDTINNMYSSVVAFKNLIYYVSYSMTTEVMSLVRQDVNTGQIKTILSRGGANDHSGEGIDYFFLDSKGQYLFWSGTHGLSRTNLSTLKTDRIINSGYGSNTYIYYFNLSPLNGQIIATCSVDSIINPLLCHTKHYSLEFSSDGKCRRKVELPD